MAADKNSRYRANPAVAGPDARGRITLAQGSRPLPTVTGTFRHVLRDGDRVDQLAELYYGDPLLWWQICDANPEFLSPWALLGQDPVVTAGFTIRPTSSTTWEGLWPKLFAALHELPGVERVILADGADWGGSRHGHRVLVTYNRLTRQAQVKDVITAIGGTIDEATLTTRAGKQIVIPPAQNG
jgi:hypothetical protein